MTTIKPLRSQLGVTLLEILIAVVVLSVGLLALTALQGALLRAASDAKARSTAVALATEKIETMRAFTGLFKSPSAATCQSSDPSYECLITSSASTETLADSSAALSGAAGGRGGTNFTRSWTVTSVGTATAPLYKTVEVKVGWVNSDGDASVVLRDVIAAIDPAASMRVLSGGTGSARGIQKRIFNPANDTGVIPIATGGGGGEAAAASDPRPLTFGSSGKVSTSFTVQTYTNDSQGFVVKNEFESKVVSCKCTLKTSAVASGVLEPAYWDGDRFVSPSLRRTSAGVIKTNLTWGSRKTAVAQDESGCDICCKNHHDTDGGLVVNTSNPEKTPAIYDPYRNTADITSSDHNHYDRTALGPPPVFSLAGNNNDYDEVCRLVRVDGVFRVTPDIRLEDIKQLSMTGTPAILDSSTRTAYSGYAATFIKSLWTQLNGGTEQANLADATPSPDDGLAQINPILLAISGQTHDLTARAIFLEWLHPVTIAKAKCAGQTTNATCLQKYRSAVNRKVLQIVPFLTVNLTNLGEWRSATVSQVSVTNDPIPNSLNTVYGRGRVTAASTTTSAVPVSTRTYRGPAALADQLPTNPVSAGNAPYDMQVRKPLPLVVERGFSVLGAGARTEFKIEMSGSGTGVNFKPEQIGAYITNGACARGNPVTRHDCAIANAATSSTFTIANYNTVVVKCKNGEGNPRDSQDPATVCVKNNGTENPPESVDQYFFKVCSISGPTGSVFTRQSPVLTVSNHPATEYTQFVATFSADATMLASKTLTALFIPATSTCP